MDTKPEIIAITADTHFREDKSDNLYGNLENILQELTGLSVSKLVVAGDVFDKDYSNYSKLANLISRYDVEVYLIPGNHDENLSQKYFSGKNITVVTQTNILYIDSDKKIPFLFVPYSKNSTMGQEISLFYKQLKDKEWFLIGHGDYFDGFRSVANYEPGIYMPLTRYDVEKFQPTRVFLGHIHKPTNSDKVFYPGSPFPLDSSECGVRRILLFDTRSCEVKSHCLKTDTVYLKETLYLHPLEDLSTFIKMQINNIISSWEVSNDLFNSISLRVVVKGCSSVAKKDIEDIIISCLSSTVGSIDVFTDELMIVSDDFTRQELLKEVNLLAREALGNDKQLEEEVVLSALKIIYS